MRRLFWGSAAALAVAGLLALAVADAAAECDLRGVWRSEVEPFLNWDGSDPGPPVGEGWTVTARE